jgi:trk system potassium uptake protein TrkA
MGHFALIGCGSFGLTVLRSLAEQRHKLVAVDRELEAVQRAKDLAYKAVVADARDQELLASLGIEQVDAAVVSLGGQRIDASVLATLHLKAIGVARVVVKAVGEDHARILRALAADEVILPERDAAVSLAGRLGSPRIHEQLTLEDGLQIVELEPPEGFVGTSLRELDLRSQFSSQVILIRRPAPADESEQARHVRVFPRASEVIRPGDRLVVLAETDGLERLKKLT